MKRIDRTSGKEYDLKYAGLSNIVIAVEGKKIQSSLPWPKFRGIEIDEAILLEDGTWLLEIGEDGWDTHGFMIARKVK